MKLHVMVGSNPLTKKLLSRIGKRLEKRKVKGQIEYTQKEDGLSTYYQIWGDDEYVNRVYKDLSDFLDKIQDNNLWSKAAAKINKKLSDAHRERCKSVIGSLLDIRVWRESDDGTMIDEK